jgi:SPX domain protein involved in polyphosphate accumulation
VRQRHTPAWAVEDKVQLQRFELKYRVDEDTARAIREFVRGYLEPDEYGVDKPNYSYRIHSLYLDSDDLRCFWDVFNSNKNRFKLRIRYYDDNPDTPAFCEIKRRVNEAILKQRCAIRKDAVAPLLSGQLPDPSFLISQKPHQLEALQEFCRRISDLNAKPRTHVSYLREAWVSPGSNAVRICLDRQVCSEPQSTPELKTEMENPVMPFEPEVILELKFTGRFPNWMGDLVRTFGLRQLSSAKYADGVALLGERRLAPESLLILRDDLLERYLQRRHLPGRLGQPA